MKKALSTIAVGWGFIVIILFIYTDFGMPESVVNSDYLMTFHTSGQLVREGNASKLYPAKGATSFIDCEFDKAAHRVLPILPKESTAEYMYMPVVAALFVPFSLLPPPQSQLAWQIVSLIALAFSSFLISSYASKIDQHNEDDVPAGWLALSILPLTMAIWIGQVSVVCGLLPLIVGLYFALKRKDFTAGLMWSLAALKPQYFIPAAMMIVALATARRFKPMLGVICGGIVFLVLNLVLFGPNLFGEWLSTLKLADVVYSDLRMGVKQNLAVSLPRAIILMLPVAQHGLIKPIIYAVSVLFGAIGIFFSSKLMRSSLPDHEKISLSAIICIFAMPIIVPHVFLYDYAIFAAVLFLAYSFKWPEHLSWRVRSLFYATWILLNGYSIMVIAYKPLAIPIVFVLLMLELYRRSLSIANAALKYAQPEDSNSPQS